MKKIFLIGAAAALLMLFGFSANPTWSAGAYAQSNRGLSDHGSANPPMPPMLGGSADSFNQALDKANKSPGYSSPRDSINNGVAGDPNGNHNDNNAGQAAPADSDRNSK